MYHTENATTATKNSRSCRKMMPSASETDIKSAMMTARLVMIVKLAPASAQLRPYFSRTRSSNPFLVSKPMRAVTEKMVSRKGMHSSTTHSSECPNAAPTTVAVMMAEGSRSAAPVTTPGPSASSCRHTEASACGGDADRGANRRTLPRSAGVPLRNFWELTTQVSFNLAFMPQAERLGVGDDAVG